MSCNLQSGIRDKGGKVQWTLVAVWHCVFEHAGGHLPSSNGNQEERKKKNCELLVIGDVNGKNESAIHIYNTSWKK